MSDHLGLTGNDFLVHERVGVIRSSVHEAHGVPKPKDEQEQPGRLHRLRATLGRRLVSIGSTVAGQGA